LMNDITSPVKIRVGKSDLMEKLNDISADVVVTVGAGDIDTFVEPIKQLLISKYEV
jgi:UDP-N-acetylmuramate--alanine ligase